MSHVKSSGRQRFAEAKTRADMAVEAASYAGALLVQAEVVRRVPVKTGKLRAFFASPDALSPSRKYRGAYVYGLKSSLLHRDAFYAPFIEYGTKGYDKGEMRVWRTGKDGRTRAKKVKRAVAPRKAQPFFRPGVAAARAATRLAIVEHIKKALKEQ